MPTVYDQENENGPTDDPGPAPPCEDDKVNKKFIKSALYFTYILVDVVSWSKRYWSMTFLLI